MTLHQFWEVAVNRGWASSEEMATFAQAHRGLYKDEPTLPRPTTLRDWQGELEAYRILALLRS